MILTPGFGPCCCCEGEIRHNPGLMMLEFKGPPGWTGWGCMVCGLPSRGAIAVLCPACVLAQRLPQFIAAGRNVADNLRLRLDEHFEQRPFRHRLGAACQMAQLPPRRG